MKVEKGVIADRYEDGGAVGCGRDDRRRSAGNSRSSGNSLTRAQIFGVFNG